MENWVSVSGYPNYAVSDKGRVKRIEHIAHHSRYGRRFLPERLLNPRRNHDGYMRTRIGGSARFVHVLVLESFVGPRPEGMQACHNNGDPSDNRLENLRWDTPKNNVKDRKSHGTYQWLGRNPNSNYTDDVYKKIIESDDPTSVLCKKLNVSYGSVYSIRRRRKEHPV